MELLRERAAGFVAAQIQEPFLVPRVRTVSRQEIQGELLEMSRSLLEEKTGWTTLLRPLEEGVLRFLSGRIMGLYTQRYEGDFESEILLNEERIGEFSVELGLRSEEAKLWVLSHEMFHAAQLDPDLPLREEMKRRVRRFLHKREGLGDLQAAYTWIEGSADWLMDQPGLLAAEQILGAREVLLARREQLSWATLLLRLLGNKQAQYSRGRRFTEKSIEDWGHGSLLLPARRPELLPRANEDPREWSERLGRTASL